MKRINIYLPFTNGSLDSLTVVSKLDVDHDPRVCHNISVSVLQAGIARKSYVRLPCEIISSILIQRQIWCPSRCSVTYDVKPNVCREYPDRRVHAAHIFFIVYQNPARFPLVLSSMNKYYLNFLFLTFRK